ncbi:hypothetical protein ACU6U9_15235 [Pseudomonas sp. HK3]
MSLTLPSQLLLQQDLPKNALLINPPRDDLAQELDESTWHVASFSYAVQQQYQSAGYTSTDVCAPLTQEYSNVVIYYPPKNASVYWATWEGALIKMNMHNRVQPAKDSMNLMLNMLMAPVA